MNALRPQIEEITKDLLDRLADSPTGEDDLRVANGERLYILLADRPQVRAPR